MSKKRFEHKVVEFWIGHSARKEQAIEKKIELYTVEGWEFVSLAASHEQDGVTFFIVFRAPA